tara:strand:+ start:2907 stop:3182 length:276 start_codon:yes stop_codon:yes gene_type:complete
MAKRKFFTTKSQRINDINQHHTFSLDHVVSIKSYDRYSFHDHNEKSAHMIEITLEAGGQREVLVVWFDLDGEKERDMEYKRLNKALTKNNS